MILAISLALCCLQPARSQNNSDSIGDSAAIREQWATTSDNMRNIHTPQFIFLSPNKKFSLQIGGYVNATANYDFNGYVEGPDFISSLIETPNSTVKNGQLNFDIKTSRITFRVVDYNVNGKELAAYIETDFRGTGKTLRIRRGFVTYSGLLIGQDWTTMMDQKAFPVMVNFQGPSAAFANWPMMVRYTHHINSNLEATIALEEPYFSLNKVGISSQYSSKPQTLPNIPAYIEYTRNGNHLRLTAFLNPMSYHTNDNNANHSAYGWTTQLSGLGRFTSKLSASFNAMYGKGVANLTQDFYDQGYNLIPSEANQGVLKPLPMVAAYGAISYSISSKMLLTGGYSFVKFDYGTATVDSWYKKGDMAWGTLFWYPTPYVQIGVEYTRGHRVNLNSDKGTANRLAAMIQYNF